MKTASRFLLSLAALTLSLGGCVDMEGLEADAPEDVSSTAAPVLSTTAAMFTELELLNGWHIKAEGDVLGGSFVHAQCFTSLEGASFVLSPADSTALVLQNGWTHAPSGTRDAAVAEADGTIRFMGAITGGTTGVAFTLPARLRPPADVYVSVTLCNAAKGRLEIQSNGEVTVQAEDTFSDAQCMTSLEGASFELGSRSWSSIPLVLNHGWTDAPFGTRAAAVKSDRGHIRFEGAIAGGTTAAPITLPSGFRPATDVYVSVDLCDARKGRLRIEPNGAVTVQAEGAFSAAQCFTSLEGVSFAL